MIPIEEEFHKAMLLVYERAKTECRYNATRFLQMVCEQGGLNAAKPLLRAEALSDGFVALWECGRLDLTMEALLLNPKWEALFSDEERAIARRRLSASGYKS
ncbi:MAG: hypothetical protein HYX92_19180 [Chloroflexi bacterium]|nr:hypothetical protein [Chloroflexota bacterium]